MRACWLDGLPLNISSHAAALIAHPCSGPCCLECSFSPKAAEALVLEHSSGVLLTSRQEPSVSQSTCMGRELRSDSASSQWLGPLQRARAPLGSAQKAAGKKKKKKNAMCARSDCCRSFSELRIFARGSIFASLTCTLFCLWLKTAWLFCAPAGLTAYPSTSPATQQHSTHILAAALLFTKSCGSLSFGAAKRMAQIWCSANVSTGAKRLAVNVHGQGAQK